MSCKHFEHKTVLKIIYMKVKTIPTQTRVMEPNYHIEAPPTLR